MPTSKHRLLFVFLAGTLLCAGSGDAQTQRRADQSATSNSPQRSSSAPVTTVDQAIDRVIAREHEEVATIWRFNPVMETYIQDMKPNSDTGALPLRDHYFVGHANLEKSVVEERFSDGDKEREGRLLGKSASHGEDHFVKLAYADPNGFDREHYEFEYVRRELLGDVRCLVFDVTPLRGGGDERFRGRIWAEDQNFTIVRFNGVHTSKEEPGGRELHFDSWRFNLQPNIWLPTYIYAQESDAKDRDVRFKAQIRFWGYGAKNDHGDEDLQEASDDSSAASDRQENQTGDKTAQAAERRAQLEAANRTIAELQVAGLLAPRGELDHVMEIVVNNLEVTNNLDIQPEIRCRTLLTSTLESFSVGHTIVLSRGLLDALPDEASLAAMLAQEMAAILAGPPAKADRKSHEGTGLERLSESGHFMLKYSDNEIQAANQKALELLRNSPYKAKLDSPGMFLEQVAGEHKVLSALISPRVGDRANLGGELAGAGAARRTGNSDRSVAVRMGTRVKLDPWSNQITLLKAKPAAPVSAREYDPFELLPLFPYLTRNQGEDSNATTRSGKSAGKKPSTGQPGAEGSTPGDAPAPTPPQ
ncbi:MAG: hypothetical protein WAU89_21885 [Candidatus Acidiferrales bacterium]